MRHKGRLLLRMGARVSAMVHARMAYGRDSISFDGPSCNQIPVRGCCIPGVIVRRVFNGAVNLSLFQTKMPMEQKRSLQVSR
jgi:hypothetical protein